MKAVGRTGVDYYIQVSDVRLIQKIVRYQVSHAWRAGRVHKHRRGDGYVHACHAGGKTRYHRVQR